MHRAPIDPISATRHAERIDEDFALLRLMGIRTVREGVPWTAVQQRDCYDWTALDRLAAASQRHQVQVIYDLFHFGYPEHLDIFSNDFLEAFAEYCYFAAERIGSRSGGPHFITPVNEPSYFAWAGGEAARFPPYANGRASELKLQLAKAAIAGTEAIWSILPDVRIVTVDPICRAVAPRRHPSLGIHADAFNVGAVLESWDILSGRLYPELGGTRRHLGILGVSFYWTNQWELGAEDIPLAAADERRWPLSRLMEFVWQRYGGPVLIAETGHIDDMRGPWMRQLGEEISAILDRKIPLEGVCLYPILGMPDWHSPGLWLNMGLWDLVVHDGTYDRIICQQMLESLPHLHRLGERAQKENQWERMLPPTLPLR